MSLKCEKKCRRVGTSQLIKHKTHQMLPVIEGNILKQSTQMFEEETSRGGTLSNDAQETLTGLGVDWESS
jgi:hypothetical protein